MPRGSLYGYRFELGHCAEVAVYEWLETFGLAIAASVIPALVVVGLIFFS